MLSCLEVEFLDRRQYKQAPRCDVRVEGYIESACEPWGIVRTSVSIANPGFQSTGGIILQIPNCDASGAIFFIYWNGSLNSSIVGRYVGASCRPCGRIFLVVSRLAVGWPRLSTLDRSSGADFMALRCTGAGAALPFAAPFARVEGALLAVALAGEARVAADEPPLVVGTCTII